MKISINLLILLIMTAIPSSHTLDIAEEGRRIILQSDIETVLIHTRLENVDNLLIHLQQEAATIRNMALHDHVSNKLGKGKARINKLISSSIISLIKQIQIVRQDYDQFFKDNAEPENNIKRAIEILGSFLSTMTGVPSARDHRRVLEQVRALKLDSSEIRSLMKSQNAMNHDILKTFHFQENLLQNISQENGLIATKTLENGDNIEKMMSVLSMTNKINAALESARIAIMHMKAIMAADKHSHLSKFVISNAELSKIIDKIYLKRKVDIPIFAGVECHNYFTQPIAHSWASMNTRVITTLLQIPIAPMHQIYELKMLNQQNQLHTDLPLAVVNQNMNTFRYLSMSDYAKCLKADNALICQKRTISIAPKLGCNIKRQNCDVWAMEVIHDISNSQILIDLTQESIASLQCDGQSKRNIKLPSKAVVNLDIHCALEAENFSIGKISYRQLRELEYEQDSVELSFNLEHEALAEEKTDSLIGHKTIKTARNDIQNLLIKNKEIKFDLVASEIASGQRWEKAKKGNTVYPWENILMWVLISLLILAVVSLTSWVLKIQIKQWRGSGREGTYWNDDKEKKMMRELSTQVKNLVTDARISRIEANEDIERDVNNESIYAEIQESIYYRANAPKNSTIINSIVHN